MALKIAEKQIKNILHESYNGVASYSKAYLRKKNKFLANLVKLEPNVYAKLASDKDKGITICVDFYSYTAQHHEIEGRFWIALQRNLQKEGVDIVF